MINNKLNKKKLAHVDIKNNVKYYYSKLYRFFHKFFGDDFRNYLKLDF